MNQGYEERMNMNDEAKELMNYMSDLSEEAYHAGWMMNLEYDLWQAVVDGPRSYGQMIIEKECIEKLKELSHRCGGWIVFDDEKEETFVPSEQWLKIYEEKVASDLNR